MKINLESEPYSRFGNISADGIRKLLGAPPLDRLTTMVRETVQNSWDARIQDQRVIPEYLIRWRRLETAQARFLRDIVFETLPPDAESEFNKALVKGLSVVEVSDYGTVGLGGPTQPTDVAGEDEKTNFLDFLRNVGTPRNEIQGGGTYGFGKSSLFSLSELSTILIDTETESKGRPVHRFMGCRIGANYTVKKGSEKGRYTGRHWWGKASEAGLEPVTGRDAQTVANNLGLPARAAGQTGTTIVVVAPVLPCGAEEVGVRIARTLLVNFWPKMVERTAGRRPIKFRVEVDGQDVVVPRPEETPPFALFAKALVAARSGDARKGANEVRHGTYNKVLGYWAGQEGPIKKRSSLLDSTEDSGDVDPCIAPSHHYALMRPAELVVKYVEGPVIADPTREWGGVFTAGTDDEVEAAFAESEPPAHDDWNPNFLSDNRKKSIVKVALNRLKADIKSRFGPPVAPVADSGSDFPLGAAADRFGHVFLAGGLGSGVSPSADAPGRGRGGGGSSGASDGLRLGQASFLRLDVRDGTAAAVFEVPCANPDATPRLIEASPYLVMDGQAVEPAALPIGIRRPRVLGWNLGDDWTSGPRLRLAEGSVLVELFITCDGEHTSTVTVREVGGD